MHEQRSTASAPFIFSPTLSTTSPSLEPYRRWRRNAVVTVPAYFNDSRRQVRGRCPGLSTSYLVSNDAGPFQPSPTTSKLTTTPEASDPPPTRLDLHRVQRRPIPAIRPDTTTMLKKAASSRTRSPVTTCASSSARTAHPYRGQPRHRNLWAGGGCPLSFGVSFALPLPLRLDFASDAGDPSFLCMLQFPTGNRMPLIFACAAAVVTLSD
ncbi:hypothetical protein DFP72DRAFT_1067788 [Ephemerocybe angulata]|uniref:Uncharacterized protein n=1 Tax=Ephemerocybe angulata TaxID=980116 RepID=A0A8H6M546_9AGAR|nr:hypothetical protein DFP72DRAFT_1067788 [Tulosesus angulatus]